MAGKICAKFNSDISDILMATYAEAESKVVVKVQEFSRKIARYEKKAELYDIASRYLRNGTTKVSKTDQKKVGATYAKELEKIINFNKKLKKAKEAKDVSSGLKRQVTNLTSAKKKLQAKYDELKLSYDKKAEKLEKKYAKAEFVQNRLKEIREMSDKDIEENMKDGNAFLRTTYFGKKGKERPTEVTYILEQYIDSYKQNKEVEAAVEAANEISKRHLERIDEILKVENPYKKDKASGKPARKK